MPNPSLTVGPLEQVRAAKARYCRLVDTKQWSAFADLLLPAPSIRFFAPTGEVVATYNKRDEFVQAAQSFVDNAQTIHQVHNDELSLVSEDEVQAIWSMEDYIVFPADAADRPARLHGYGHYHETWVRTPAGWRIAQLDLRRTILEITPQPEAQA